MSDQYEREEARSIDRQCNIGWNRAQSNVPVTYTKPIYSIEYFTALVIQNNIEMNNEDISAYDRCLAAGVYNDIQTHVARYPEYAAVYNSIVRDDLDFNVDINLGVAA